MTGIAPIEGLLALDPQSIPDESDVDWVNYGQDGINLAYDYYGNPKEDSYEGRTIVSAPILNCTKESLQLEYAGYKNYVCTQKKEKAIHFSAVEKSAKSRLALAEAKKYKSQKVVKELKKELHEVQQKIKIPLTAEDLLKDSVVEAAFPNIRRLLVLYILVPQSEAVVERGFSKMKLIMTDKRTNLDNDSLEALMRLSYKSTPLSADEVNEIIEIWRSSSKRRIFSNEM